jgi:NADH:ubiquinone oxidoreductase subunit
MTLGTRLFTMLCGDCVGTDARGNRYYRAKRRRTARRERRWVLFDGAAEASKVPPEWHAWLHHTRDDIPGDDAGRVRPWQQEHVPNLTGTPEAYRPPGHVLKGGRRGRASGDYEPWEPP